MSFWVILWAVVAAFLLGFMLWTNYLLILQRKNWRLFARHHKMRWHKANFLASPIISGKYKGYTIAAFTSEHKTTDVRGSRLLTAIEVQMKSKMPTAGVIASGGMIEIMRSLRYTADIHLSVNGWDKDVMVRANDRAIMEAYLTPPRLDVLKALMGRRNIWVVLVFDEQDIMLRVDLPDPLETEAKLLEILDVAVKAAEILDLQPGEGRKLLAEIARQSAKQQVINVSDATVSAASGLQLEDDGAAAVVVPALQRAADAKPADVKPADVKSEKAGSKKAAAAKNAATTQDPTRKGPAKKVSAKKPSPKKSKAKPA